MLLDQTSLKPFVSTANRPKNWPGPRKASCRFTVPQPLRLSGTWTIWPAVGLGTAVPLALLRVAFCRAVVNIVYSACSLFMYGKRCMIKLSADASCGPAIDVPDELP